MRIQHSKHLKDKIIEFSYNLIKSSFFLDHDVENFKMKTKFSIFDYNEFIYVLLFINVTFEQNTLQSGYIPKVFQKMCDIHFSSVERSM